MSKVVFYIGRYEGDDEEEQKENDHYKKTIKNNIINKIQPQLNIPKYSITTKKQNNTIEKYIESKFPLAVKITNDHLHKQHPRINQEYYKRRIINFSKARKQNRSKKQK